MHTGNTLRRAAFVSLLVAPLLLGNRGCESDTTTDAGGEPGTVGGGSAEGGAAHDAGAGSGPCSAKQCEGMAVPAIACADGPTLTVCERNQSGVCTLQVRCGQSGGAGDSGVTQDPSGSKCGGFAGATCAKGQFCNVETTAGGDGCVNIADGQGVCQEQPSACSKEYKPVCGCNYRTYGNVCEAHAQGISVMHDGQCTAEECQQAGGRPEYSDGASIPSCQAGEESFAIPGIEPAICCVPKP